MMMKSATLSIIMMMLIILMIAMMVMLSITLVTTPVKMVVVMISRLPALQIQSAALGPARNLGWVWAGRTGVGFALARSVRR
ncbi:MAG: hypothetical protein QF577_11080, partial [Phycisphaerae bacterium]|nr:hypothetical protein [Phycisphaerae bacterium]